MFKLKEWAEYFRAWFWCLMFRLESNILICSLFNVCISLTEEARVWEQGKSWKQDKTAEISHCNSHFRSVVFGIWLDNK